MVVDARVFEKAGIPAEVLRDKIRKVEVKRGSYVYQAGESPKGIYAVQSGLVGLLLTGPSGKEHFMRFFTSGQVFGHRALIAEEDYHATTQALETTELDFLSKNDWIQLLVEYPSLHQFIIKQLATELRHCELQQVSILDQHILPRIARAIVYLKEIHPTYRWTRSEMASFCASTTSTVIKALAELEYKGLIKQKGRDIVIVDRPALIHYVD